MDGLEYIKKQGVPVKKRILGKTGLEVSELALGGIFVSTMGGDFDQTRAAARRAVELDINYIDTAPSYANSEETIGRALEGVEAPLIFSTKLGGRPRPFEPQNPHCLMQSVEESLRLLKRDYIDILFVHEPDRPLTHHDWWTDAESYGGPVLDVLEDLKRQNLIGYTGLGGTTAYEIVPIMRTGRFDVILAAFNYSLLWREAEHAILPAARELDMGLIIGSPMQQGALARVYDEEVRHGAPWLSPPRRQQYIALYDLVRETDLSLPEVALRFVLSNPDISCVLTGASSQAEVEENVAAAAKGPLPADIIQRLDEIAAMVPFRPLEEPFCLFSGRE